MQNFPEAGAMTKKSDDLILLIDFSLQSSSASGPIGRRVEEKCALGSFTRQSITRSLAVKTNEFVVIVSGNSV